VKLHIGPLKFAMLYFQKLRQPAVMTGKHPFHAKHYLQPLRTWIQSRLEADERFRASGKQKSLRRIKC
jgi:hypothetical protein